MGRDPSIHDCGAPWNMDEEENPETDECVWICNCTSCKRSRKRRYEED
jgi:hypothetical protein